MMSDQEAECHSLGEFGSTTEPSVTRIETPGDLRSRLLEKSRRQVFPGCFEFTAAAQTRDDFRSHALEIFPALPKGGGGTLEDSRKSRPPVMVAGGEIRPSKEGNSSGSKENGQRPASRTGRHLDIVHVDCVQFGTFLSIHLDVDETLVHERRNGLILEGLPLHHMAPVAGGVADAQKNRSVQGFCQAQRLFSPGMPVHRIPGVLEQVGARFVAQAVTEGGVGGRHESGIVSPLLLAGSTRLDLPGVVH